ncbi:MAG: hypothetical protein RLY31_994 [Bacteroidota bacterium]
MIRLLPSLLVLLLGLSYRTSVAQVIINEFSAANRNGITDNYGEREDWIELYNVGTETVDLSGYFLSDQVTNTDKWPFPAGVSIDPGEYLLVFASDRDELSPGGAVHAGFKITQTKQEYIALFDPQQVLLDAFQIVQPNQANHSTGRVEDAAPEWGVFAVPTPGGPNADASIGYAPLPSASHAAGFHPGPIQLSVTVPEGTTVRYTLDGSEPAANSPAYSNPITLSQTTVLKTKAFPSNPALLPSFTDGNTFLIGVNHSIPVVSIAGNGVAALLDGTQNEPTGSFEIFRNGTRIDAAYGEFNKHGNDSWAYPQRGVDYITRDQLGYASSISDQLFPTKDRDNFQRLILKAAANDNYNFSNGGAHIRDAYVHTLSQRAGLELDERTYEPCVLYVNGNYWGVYEIREKVDDPDYTRHYYDQGEKWIDYIKTWGGTWEEYGSRADWDALHDFILTEDMTLDANYDYVQEQLNVLSLIDYMIINTHVVCKDWLNWNTAWWRGRKPEGGARQWRYTLWDMDASFGHYTNYTGIPNDSPTALPCFAENLSSDFEGHGDLVSALLANETFHSLYVNRYADLNNSYLGCDYMVTLLDSMVANISPEMQGQFDKWGGSMASWLSNVQQLRNFILARCEFLDPGIVDCYDVEGPFPVLVQVKPANVLNKVRVNTFVPPGFPFVGDYFSGTQLSFQSLPQDGWELDHWEVANHSFGPDAFAEAIQFGLSTTIGGDTVTAFFRPSIPCANAGELVLDSTLSSVQLTWEGPSNAISYEVGYRLSGGTDDWETVSVTGTSYQLAGLDECTSYEVRIRSICDFGLGQYQYRTFQTACLSGLADDARPIPEWSVYPNPFREACTVDLLVGRTTNIRLDVFTPEGRSVWRHEVGIVPPGQHRIPIRLAQNLPPGVYFVRLTTGSERLTRRLVRLH